MRSENQVLLETKDLRKYFSGKKGLFHLNPPVVKAVDDINLTIHKGETLGLVGESGCGKSTLGRTILKLIPMTSGQVIYNGEDIAAYDKKQMWEMRKRMQIIFQDPYSSLNPRMTVYDLVSAPLEVYGIGSAAERKEMVISILNDVGLDKQYLNRFPHEFSGGQRQRIGIARALAAEPEFIVCDEPISALDVSIQAQVINILEELQDKFHFTYLFISHDLSMVRHISSEVGVMYLGSLIEYARVDELYDNMLHPYTQSLISAVPVADPKLAKENKRIILEGDVPSPINPAPGCPFRSRCRYAKDICSQAKPELKAVNDKHKVACHLFD